MKINLQIVQKLFMKKLVHSYFMDDETEGFMHRGMFKKEQKMCW